MEILLLCCQYIYSISLVTLLSYWNRRCIPRKLYACDNFQVSIALETNKNIVSSQNMHFSYANSHSQLIGRDLLLQLQQPSVLVYSLRVCIPVGVGDFKICFVYSEMFVQLAMSTAVMLCDSRGFSFHFISNKSKPNP